MIEFGSRPRIEGDTGEQQRTGGSSPGPKQIAAEQINEDEGGSDEKLRDEIGRPTDSACCKSRYLQHPTRHGWALVRRNPPLAAPHVALDDIDWGDALC